MTAPGRPQVPPGMWATIVSQLVAMLVLAGLGTWYIGREGQEADHRWCDLLVPLDDAYSSTPPQTELGRRIAAAMRKLRTDLGC